MTRIDLCFVLGFLSLLGLNRYYSTWSGHSRRRLEAIAVSTMCHTEALFF